MSWTTSWVDLIDALSIHTVASEEIDLTSCHVTSLWKRHPSAPTPHPWWWWWWSMTWDRGVPLGVHVEGIGKERAALSALYSLLLWSSWWWCFLHV